MPTPKRGYYIDGERVPSVTTVLKAGAFFPGDAGSWWASGLAVDATFDELRALKNVVTVEEFLKDEDLLAKVKKTAKARWYKTRDRAGQVGTALHDAIEHFPNEPEYDPQWTSAEWTRIFHGFKNHGDWVARRRPKVVVQEVQLVSRTLRSGGTPDLVVKLNLGRDEERTFLTDHKSSRNLSSSVVPQLGAYAFMLEEQVGIRVDGAIVFHHPEPEEEGALPAMRVVPLTRKHLDLGVETFKACRALYDFIPQCGAALEKDEDL